MGMSGMKKPKPEQMKSHRKSLMARLWRRQDQRSSPPSSHTKEASFTGNGLQISQLTQTGVGSKYESSSLDNLNQQFGCSQPATYWSPRHIYCLELTETDYISQDAGQQPGLERS